MHNLFTELKRRASVAIKSMPACLVAVVMMCAVGFAGADGNQAQAQEAVIADARGDFVAGTNDGDPGVLSASGTGTWRYLDSATPNPADSGVLNQLLWNAANNGYYGVFVSGSTNAVDLQNANLGLDEVRVHPSGRNPKFAVVRWEAGSGEDGQVTIAGTFRKVDVAGGDGVTFEIFVDGASIFNATLPFNDNTGVSFNETVTLNQNAKVDFVVGPSGFDSHDSTGLKVTISKSAPTSTIADARGDFVAGTNDGDPGVLSASGTGTWRYLDSATPNPADSGVLNQLLWNAPNNGYYGVFISGSTNAVDLQNANLGLDEVRVHPSGRNPKFAVVRWEAGSGEDGQVTIAGTFRKVDVAGGDGVTFEIFVDGASIFNATLPFNDNTGVSFNETVTLNQNAKVDFVVGPSGFDSHDSTGLTVTITKSLPTNNPPTANAGPDQSIRAGDTVNLDGSASFDDNTASGALLYAWNFSSVPAGSAAVLTNADTATPSFVADVQGAYVVELVVTDEGGLASLADEVEVSSDNLAPVANAGSDKLIVIGATVNLDGTGSTDPEMDPLSYSWSITSAPAGNTATLIGANTATPSITPDAEGTYQINLNVSDLIGPGTPDTVDITVASAEDFAVIEIVAADVIVDALQPGQVTTGGNQNAFLNFLTQAVEATQEDDLAKAIDKLEKAIARTDGCVLRGEPDGNEPGRDWITDCAAQMSTYNLLTDALNALQGV